MAWVFVLVLWQQTLVLSGVSLEKTARRCLLFVAPYTAIVMTLLFLGNYVDSAFLTLFYVCNLSAVLVAGIATAHTLRTMALFEVTRDSSSVTDVSRALKGDLFVSLAQIKSFLFRTSILAAFLVLFILVLILLGNEKHSSCSNVLFWATWDFVSTFGAVSLLWTFRKPTFNI